MVGEYCGAEIRLPRVTSCFRGRGLRVWRDQVGVALSSQCLAAGG